jgi:uncharacterized lipoprotein YmbA
MTTRRMLVLVLLATGCSFFSRTKNTFYSIEPIAPAAAVAAARGTPIAIESLELPPGFDRREIIVRKADHQLDVRATEQWSALFSQSVLHALAFDLAKRLPEGMVVLPGALKPDTAIRSIDLALEDLAAGPDAKVVVDARWIVHEGGRPDVTHHERFTVDIKSLDSASVANGMSEALAELANRIAAQLH